MSLEDEIVAFVVDNFGAFPEHVIEHFGAYREPEINASIKSAVRKGALTESWHDDRPMGGVRYSILAAPKVWH